MKWNISEDPLHVKLGKVRNTVIKQKTNFHNSFMDWARYKLEWYGHIHRMPETRLPTQLWEWFLSGRG